MLTRNKPLFFLNHLGQAIYLCFWQTHKRNKSILNLKFNDSEVFGEKINLPRHSTKVRSKMSLGYFTSSYILPLKWAQILLSYIWAKPKTPQFLYATILIFWCQSHKYEIFKSKLILHTGFCWFKKTKTKKQICYVSLPQTLPEHFSLCFLDI